MPEYVRFLLLSEEMLDQISRRVIVEAGAGTNLDGPEGCLSEEAFRVRGPVQEERGRGLVGLNPDLGEVL